MPLKQEQKDIALDAMKKFTGKGLKSSKEGGGHFYYVSDSKGVEAALIVMATSKDEKGSRTSREGRGILKAFKKCGRAIFCEGSVSYESSKMYFSIDKGSAKPSIIKKAFKQCAMLHEGVGSSLVGILKGAKIQMAVAPSQPAEVLSEDDKQRRIDQWKVENAALSIEMEGDLSDEEILELFAAEASFKSLGNESEELEALELEQEEKERTIRELENIEEEFEELEQTLNTEIEEWKAKKASGEDFEYVGDYENMLQAHLLKENIIRGKLKEKRLALASKIAVSSDTYDETSDKLSPQDKATFEHAMEVGFGLISDRVELLKADIQQELKILQTIDWEDTSKGMVERRTAYFEHSNRKGLLESELRAIVGISASF
jgi:hypothetical protein